MCVREREKERDRKIERERERGRGGQLDKEASYGTSEGKIEKDKET